MTVGRWDEVEAVNLSFLIILDETLQKKSTAWANKAIPASSAATENLALAFAGSRFRPFHLGGCWASWVAPGVGEGPQPCLGAQVSWALWLRGRPSALPHRLGDRLLWDVAREKLLRILPLTVHHGL